MVSAEQMTREIPPDRLASLLGVGASPDAGRRSAPRKAKADLLRVRLAGPLPAEPGSRRPLSAVVDRVCKEMLPLQGRALGHILLGDAVELDDLTKVRRYGKKQARRSDAEPQRSVAVTIYYAAIAAALLGHGAKISSHSYRSLAEAFQMLAGKDWMTPGLAGLFTRAQACCETKTG